MNCYPALRGILRSLPGVLATSLLLGGAQAALLTQLSARTNDTRIVRASGDVRSRLRFADDLLAAGEIAQALDVWIALLAVDAPGAIDLPGDTAISTREMCHRRIAALPPSALAVYRRRVDGQAGAWYRKGIDNRDVAFLRRIVRECFCSSWGDDALFALGDMALERGAYQEARDAWERVSPRLRSATGLGRWRQWRSSGPSSKEMSPTVFADAAAPDVWLAYPDTDLQLADVRARLVLVSLRAEQWDRASWELAAMRMLHPHAEGTLAGRRGNYVAMLTMLADDARRQSREWSLDRGSVGWSTLAGAPERHRRNTVGVRIGELAWQTDEAALPPGAEEPQGNDRRVRTLSRLHPVIDRGRLLVADDRRVFAWNLADGEAVLGDANFYDQPRQQTDRDRERMTFRRGATQFSLSLADEVLYARAGNPARLLGFDLRRQGLVTFAVAPQANASFAGAPVSDGQNVYVAVHSGNALPRFDVCCFDAESGLLRWRQSLATSNIPTSEIANPAMLTWVDDRLYLNSNQGFVAALAKQDGALEWMRTYDRAPQQPTNHSSSLDPRDGSPCIYYEGCLLVTPADTPQVFALESATGMLLWSCRSLPDAVQPLGVADRKLLLSGDQLWALDVDEGRQLPAWSPWMAASQDAAGTAGKGCVAGDFVYWPTRTALYVVDARSGRQAQPPIDLDQHDLPAGNLIVADGHAVMAGDTKLSVFQTEPARSQRASHSSQPAAPAR